MICTCVHCVIQTLHLSRPVCNGCQVMNFEQSDWLLGVYNGKCQGVGVVTSWLKSYPCVVMSEETVLVVGNVRHKKQDGSLVLTRSRIAWSPEGSSELESNTLYTQLKSAE